MKFFTWLQKQWDGIRGTQGEAQRKLLDILCKTYLDERKDLANFTWHAEQMYYPHFRERLLQLVAEEQAQVRWLEETIRARGGILPPSPPPAVRSGENTWESLLMDLQEERKDQEELLHGVRLAEQVDQEVAAGLARLRANERKHRAELLDMLMKSEPATVPRPASLPPDVQQQKRIWLARQKMEWFEQKRAVWESEGKLVPWAEWVARREHEWAVNELPNRELHWTRQYHKKTEEPLPTLLS